MPRTPSTLAQDYLCRPVLNILVLAADRQCPVLEKLLPHASATLDISVVHSMSDMEKHLVDNQTDLVVTRVLNEHADAITTPEALYRASVDQHVLLKDPLSMQLPDIPTPRLLWFADGQADLMSLHAGCWGGLDIYVTDSLPSLVTAVLDARDAIALARPAYTPITATLRAAVV